LHGKERSKFLILSAIRKPTVPTHGATAMAMKRNQLPYYILRLSIHRRQPSKWRSRARRGPNRIDKMLRPDQTHSSRNIYAAHESASGSNRTPIANWRME